MELAGSRILLTGATGGLGRAIAASLAAEGAQMLLSSRKSEELDRLIAELPGEGHLKLVCDLAEDGAAERLASEATAGGRLDGFVANAALPSSGRLDDFGPEQISRALRVNLEAPILTARALLPDMLVRGSGQLVFISSLSGKTASPRTSMYSATKFGLRGFTLALRQDLHGTGVGASLVLPGFIRDAGMFADTGVDPPPGLGTGRPEQVGDAVVDAIRNDRGELVVAPIRQRVANEFAHVFPGLAAIAQRGRGERIADEMTAAQRDKR